MILFSSTLTLRRSQFRVSHLEIHFRLQWNDISYWETRKYEFPGPMERIKSQCNSYIYSALVHETETNSVQFSVTGQSVHGVDCSDTRLRSTTRGDFLIPRTHRHLANRAFTVAAPSFRNSLVFTRQCS